MSAQGAALATELKKITKDVRLGFGSFIDKPTAPFVSSNQVQGNSKYMLNRILCICSENAQCLIE